MTPDIEGLLSKLEATKIGGVHGKYNCIRNDDVDRCIAIIKAHHAEQPAVGGWQDIGTAPEDGFHLLLYRPEICFVGYYAAGGDWVISAPGLPLMEPPPTHWMPLPKPTKATLAGAA